jgi:fatty acid-binding protein DegV
VLAVILSSALSGTFGSAEAAAKRVEDFPVVLVDSLGASLTQGLLVLRASGAGRAGPRAA